MTNGKTRSGIMFRLYVLVIILFLLFVCKNICNCNKQKSKCNIANDIFSFVEAKHYNKTRKIYNHSCDNHRSVSPMMVSFQHEAESYLSSIRHWHQQVLFWHHGILVLHLILRCIYRSMCHLHWKVVFLHFQ